MILGSGIIRKLRELYILTTPWDTGPETFNAKMPKMKKKETVKLKITHWPQIVLEKLRNLTGNKETLETHNRSINRSIDQSINFSNNALFQEPMLKRGMRVTFHI